jgi:hypothetical protein
MKKNITVIDWSVWGTQKNYAQLTGRKLSAVSQQLLRTKKGTSIRPLKYMDIPELQVTLIRIKQ